MYQILEQLDNYIHGDIAFQRIGDTESIVTNAVWVVI